MVKNKNLIQKLQFHYAVNPESEFLSTLRNDLVQQANVQKTTQNRSHKIAYALLGAFVVVAIILFATPIGSAIAQVFVSLFSRAESDVMPNFPGQTAIANEATMTTALTITPGEQSSPNPAPTKTIEPSSMVYADMTIEEVEQNAGFDILVPTYLPEIFQFAGASFDPETNIVHQFYDTGLLIQQEPVSGMEDCDLCTLIGPNTEIQIFQIGDVEAEFVVGVWKFDNEGNQLWEADPYMNRLRWQVNSNVFEIMYMGVPGTLTSEQLVKIAESFQ